MEVLTKSELHARLDEIADKVKKGAVFIHPTDTIYGLSCDASNEKAVEKIRRLKDNNDVPLSVWAPSIEWIKKNFHLPTGAEEGLKKLPGSYTVILKLKNNKAIAKNVNPGKDTIGVRIPDHWLHGLVSELNVPIITTSANKTGRKFMTKLEDLDREIQVGVEFMIYEGEKVGRPSQIIDLTNGGKLMNR